LPEPTHVDSRAFVKDTVIIVEDVPTYVRYYYFFDRWLQVGITFDERLALKPDSSPTFPFAFNCDITTPHYCRDNSIFTSDLYIDLLVGTDGYTYQIEDIEDFERAFALGLFGKTWYEGAKRGAERLAELLERKRFLDFLNEVAPFPRTKSAYVHPPMRRRDIDEIDFEYHPLYPRYG